ncbi:sigma-70 family RNA polymerase sigma factor [Mammaliicoccus sp. Dog046]|uniref:sigma-70 family RNA polymerase sigma factor n=1 Tax=Mammaliicoccus sp. Dog046 TaxID=3034233 RepID=UPI002B25D983|nr:sigma-70 family RNA polymerase sigma factor [Mammaliicoccus sp. Dog046]WQK85306.1 sigma-70 family RNA polymerase sigma factor [Mammaliicoccus sp. Dog046]
MNGIDTENKLLECIYDIQKGNVEKFNQLLKSIDCDIIRRLNTLRISKEDREDIAQIIRYKIYKQLLTLNIDNGESFSKCVNVIIKNAKVDYIRKTQSFKYKMNFESLRIDDDCGEGYRLAECISDNKSQTFEEAMIIKNVLLNLLKHKRLTTMEVNVVKLTLAGKTKKEISKELNVPVKLIYNAQYRVKKKLNRAEITAALFDN